MSGSASSLLVKYFDPKIMPWGVTIYLNGKRGTGKTKLIIDLLAYMRHCSHCVVICPTAEATKTYAKHVPSLFIYRQWTPEIVDKILDAQLAMGDAVSQYPCVLVFDDCLFDPKFARHVSTRNLYMNGRHANITVICAGQYMMDLPPAIRTNTDYVFMLTENSRNNREKLYKNFGGVFDNFKDFDECFKQVTENYNAMVIDNKSLSNSVQDIVFYYKATLDLRFRVGHPSLWEYANEKTADLEEEGPGLRRRRTDELVPFQDRRPTLVVHKQAPH